MDDHHSSYFPCPLIFTHSSHPSTPLSKSTETYSLVTTNMATTAPMIATAMTTAMILAVMSSCSSWGLVLPDSGCGSFVETVIQKPKRYTFFFILRFIVIDDLAEKCFENDIKELFVNIHNIMETNLNFVKNY